MAFFRQNVRREAAQLLGMKLVSIPSHIPICEFDLFRMSPLPIVLGHHGRPWLAENLFQTLREDGAYQHPQSKIHNASRTSDTYREGYRQRDRQVGLDFVLV